MYPDHTLTLRHLLISHYAIIDIGDTGWPINPLDRKDTHGCDSWAVFSIPPQRVLQSASPSPLYS